MGGGGTAGFLQSTNKIQKVRKMHRICLFPTLNFWVGSKISDLDAWAPGAPGPRGPRALGAPGGRRASRGCSFLKLHDLASPPPPPRPRGYPGRTPRGYPGGTPGGTPEVPRRYPGGTTGGTPEVSRGCPGSTPGVPIPTPHLFTPSPSRTSARDADPAQDTTYHLPRSAKRGGGCCA